MSATTWITNPVATRTMQTIKRSTETAFLAPVRADLDLIEDLLHTEITTDVRTLLKLVRHVLDAGGKRLRPAMVALAARSIQPNMDPSRIVLIGTAFELLHMASLVHDDVVDNTDTRRGKPTANAIYGNGVAVLSGDYILARSVKLMCEDGDMRILKAGAEISLLMSEGEVMEILATGRPDLPQCEYRTILHKKTAQFIAGCCRCGAILANASPTEEDALSDYGYRLGMAFQLADDLLDYIGDPQITGKPIGSDLRDGRATLPFLLGMERANEHDVCILRSAFADTSLTDRGVQKICDLLSKYRVFESVRSEAQEFVLGSAEVLSRLPNTEAKSGLLALTDYVVQRNR